MNQPTHNNYVPLVSVYTCVYNGAKTIHRVFDSMKKLEYPNIEHVIVNDGSTDNTDELINQYVTEVNFPIQYIKKENGGKHSALNIVWKIAKGEFMIQLDADDELLPHSITYLVDKYYSIPEDIRSEYWCVLGRCITQHGDFVGDPYPEDINNDEWIINAEKASKCKGEKIGLQVSKYLSQYRFPEVKNVHFLPEGIVWKQINSRYGTWYTNEVVRIYYVNEGNNLSAPRTKRAQFGAAAYYYKWMSEHPEDYKRTLFNPLIYSLCYFVSDKDYRKSNGYFKEITQYKLFLAILYPIMWVGAFVFRLLKKIK